MLDPEASKSTWSKFDDFCLALWLILGPWGLLTVAVIALVSIVLVGMWTDGLIFVKKKKA